MTNSNPPRGREASLAELAEALAVLRDALVNVSLMMRDVQFEMDLEARNSAIADSDELLGKVKGPST